MASNRPFAVTCIRRLVPAEEGLREEREVGLSIGVAMLDHLAGMDPAALKVLVALALLVRPLEGKEFQDLLRVGLVGEEQRGVMTAILSQDDLERLTGMDPAAIERGCRVLAAQGWVTARDVDRGPLSGKKLYFVR